MYSLDEISGIATALRTENLFRPVFYIYILTSEPIDKINKTKKEILEKIGEAIGTYIVEKLNKTIMTQLNKFNENNA